MPDERYQGLADQRARFGAEMQADTDVKARLFGLTSHEVGDQGEAAHQAFIEGVMNRAVSRGQTLKRTMGSDYYPGSSLRYVPGADYQDKLDRALAGSNVGRLNTGNAEGGSGVGFNGGVQVLDGRTTGGERFGVEGPDVKWAADTAASLGKASPMPEVARAVTQTQQVAAYDSRRANANFMQPGREFGAPGSHLARVTTEGGHKFTVHEASAPAFKGFIEDLESQGAPLGEIGGYNPRPGGIAGSGRMSQHAMGNAMDLFSQEDRDVISPEGRRWIAQHPKEWRGALDKWGMVSGGDWRNPDLGHIEWSGKKPWSTMASRAPAKVGSQAYWESTKARPAQQVASAGEREGDPGKPGSTAYWNKTRAHPSEVADSGSHGRYHGGGYGGQQGYDAHQLGHDGYGGAPSGATPVSSSMEEVDFFDDGVSDINIEVDVSIRFY